MGRIVADVNSLRSGASALRNAASNYDEIGRLVVAIVDLSSAPASLRGAIGSSRSVSSVSARQLSQTVAGRAGQLDRTAAAFDAAGTGGGSWGFGGSGWGRLKTAISVANSIFAGITGGALALTRSASVASRVLRYGPTKAARSYAAKALPRLGRAAGHLRNLNSALKPVASVARVLKRANPVLTVLGSGLDFKANRDSGKDVRESAFRAGGAAVGGAAGGAVGAVALGTLFGAATFGIGAPAGAFVGAAAGGFLGGWVGEKAGGALNSLTKKKFW